MRLVSASQNIQSSILAFSTVSVINRLSGVTVRCEWLYGDSDSKYTAGFWQQELFRMSSNTVGTRIGYFVLIDNGIRFDLFNFISRHAVLSSQRTGKLIQVVKAQSKMEVQLSTCICGTTLTEAARFFPTAILIAPTVGVNQGWNGKQASRNSESIVTWERPWSIFHLGRSEIVLCTIVIFTQSSLVWSSAVGTDSQGYGESRPVKGKGIQDNSCEYRLQ